MNKSKKKISEFMHLYNPVQHRLSAYCRVITGDEDKALDLIQETLTRAYESFHKLRDKEAFQFFLIGIARNCHLKQTRRWKLWGKQSEIKTNDIKMSSETVELQFDIKLIHKCIAKLNAEQREAILMFHIMGFSIKEIAQNSNISEAAVKNRLMRGREKLRGLLADKESQSEGNISSGNFKALTK